MKTGVEIRQTFLDYFASRGHARVASSPLVPANDPTLLFTNAGMVQFKDVFLGREARPYRRAASSQRCVRAGGKHNDLENVGYTARHHTFFEMLGNFSFGDYFKREAIEYAWELLTGVFQLPPERLWITVFEEDDDAADLWLKHIGIDPARFSRIGAQDNFWSMGETGPCGPCSEIFYDHGPSIAGGPPGTPEADGDRYVEIWNLVFMQYDRASDGTLTPLPHPSVDTGMGLERLAAVLQGVHDNYDTDLFTGLLDAVAKIAGCTDRRTASLRVIADHIRSCAFLVTDGIVPSNEGRGYVLRRIIRRALRHGHKLGVRDPFFHRLVGPLCDSLGGDYPELPAARAQVEHILHTEEERFAETLGQGMKLLEEAIAGLSGRMIPGETVFRLYDTYGFPVDLTADIARERDLLLDHAGFETAMAAQRERARAASGFATGYEKTPSLDGETVFTGYERIVDEGVVIGLYRDGAALESLTAGQEGLVVLDRTPFYAESGGQVGDAGVLETPHARFEVTDTRKQGKVFVHAGRVAEGVLRSGDKTRTLVDGNRRQATVLNHSATHLLHAALRRILGAHVTQKGSLVSPDRLRFDFSHFEPVGTGQLAQIETLVNAEIRRNAMAETRVMDLEEAMSSGAMALFGEKYDAKVRVLRLGEFSTELCGGTHVRATGDIGLFKIVSEGGVAAGVRRIEAVTGDAALALVAQTEHRLDTLAGLLKTDRESAEGRLRQVIERQRAVEKELEKIKGQMASASGSDLAGSAVAVGDLRVLAARIEGADSKSLRETVDQLKNKLGAAAIVLAAVEGGKVSLVAGVTKDHMNRLRAGDLVNAVAQRVGGKGGGRPDMAQAGGTRPEALDEALASVPDWVRSQLSG